MHRNNGRDEIEFNRREESEDGPAGVKACWGTVGLAEGSQGE